jgi:hypothetical protein
MVCACVTARVSLLRVAGVRAGVENGASAEAGTRVRDLRARGQCNAHVTRVHRCNRATRQRAE